MTSPNESAVPILPSSDLDRSAAFYGYLGFRVMGRTPDYLRVAWGRIEIHLYSTEGVDALVNPAGCYLRIGDSRETRARWHAEGVHCLDVPVPDTYGPTTFAVVDPDGNTVRFGPAVPHGTDAPAVDRSPRATSR
jgi:catechol 2,3-dioxygenase-like lactoylglutathione lyase family enzyme